MFIALNILELYLGYVFYYLRITLPISYSVDLILTIRNPLYPIGKRLWRYLAYNAFNVALLVILTASLPVDGIPAVYAMTIDLR